MSMRAPQENVWLQFERLLVSFEGDDVVILEEQ